jgi:mannose-6-phosphate isomerase-like protein (cupin superfamily)
VTAHVKIPLLLALFFTAESLAFGDGQHRQAQLTQAIKDVKLLVRQAPPQRATLNAAVPDGAAVRTGAASRAEITFPDQTLARLGANTLLSVNDSTRNLDLGVGAMLVRAPKDAIGARINAAAVTVAFAGTTALLDYHKGSYIKLIVLQGTGRVFRKGRLGESVLVRAGQMLMMRPDDALPDPVDIDLQRLMQTSVFLSHDFKPLPEVPLISDEIQAQRRAKSKGALIDTNLVIFGTGTVVSLENPTQQAAAPPAKSSTPIPR